MRYHPIDPALFIQNRKRFTEKLPAGAMAVFHSNDVQPTNADGTRPFIQDSNLFWLSGIDQEESILILFPDAPDSKQKELLFVKKTSKEIAIWEGHKYTKQEARDTSAIENVRWTSSFEPVLKKLMSEADSVYIPTEDHSRKNLNVEKAGDRFARWCKEHFPTQQLKEASRIIYPLRMIKTPLEIELISKACEITEAGFRRVLPFVKPGVWEFEVEAEYIHEFTRRRARGFAYEPIIGSGESSCVLHYIENNKQCTDGDMLLMDVGACYTNYASDMTRTVPVNGKFSARQRAIYDAVHRCLDVGKAEMKAGVTQSEHHKIVASTVEKELVDLGLISMHEIRTQDSNDPAYRKYYMHKTTHSLGLDVHDVSVRTVPFAPGMVFTCEPGIYVREEGIGVRLENNIVITEDGNMDLMDSIPIDADEIETLMNE